MWTKTVVLLRHGDVATFCAKQNSGHTQRDINP